jgi:hypothetical protein
MGIRWSSDLYSSRLLTSYSKLRHKGDHSAIIASVINFVVLAKKRKFQLMTSGLYALIGVVRVAPANTFADLVLMPSGVKAKSARTFTQVVGGGTRIKRLPAR